MAATCFALIKSMIDLEMASIATGIRALVMRSAMPPATTFGAASHTRRSTGGTLRSAASLLFQEVWLEEDTAEDIRIGVLLATYWPRTRRAHLDLNTLKPRIFGVKRYFLGAPGLNANYSSGRNLFPARATPPSIAAESSQAIRRSSPRLTASQRRRTPPGIQRKNGLPPLLLGSRFFA